MARDMWRVDCDLTGKQVDPDVVLHYDSYESFHCCLDHENVTTALIVPDSVIESCRPGELENQTRRVEAFQKKEGEKETLGSGFVFLVGTSEGNIHVFSSFSLPKKLV